MRSCGAVKITSVIKPYKLRVEAGAEDTIQTLVMDLWQFKYVW
jgi:hypothetical protein